MQISFAKSVVMLVMVISAIIIVGKTSGLKAQNTWIVIRHAHSILIKSSVRYNSSQRIHMCVIAIIFSQSSSAHAHFYVNIFSVMYERNILIDAYKGSIVFVFLVLIVL